MSSKSEAAEPVENGYFAGGSRRGSDLAKAVPAMRAAGPVTSRARISAAKSKKARAVPMGPTPERMAKDDVVRTAGGFHRSIPVIEKLRDQCKLDHDSRTNEGMYRAAVKLRRHRDGLGLDVKAQDLNKVAGGTGDDLTTEEAWVYHRDAFRTAIKLMGYSEAAPNRGAARVVVAVVCDEATVYDAAVAHTGLRDTTALRAAGMDRLREGLFALATHWRMC